MADPSQSEGEDPGSSDSENVDQNKPWFEDAFAWGGVVRLLGLTPVPNKAEDSSDG